MTKIRTTTKKAFLPAIWNKEMVSWSKESLFLSSLIRNEFPKDEDKRTWYQKIWDEIKWKISCYRFRLGQWIAGERFDNYYD